MVEITNVNIFMMKDSGKLKAFVDVTMDGEYAVHRLKVLEGDDSLWVVCRAGMIRRTTPTGMFSIPSRARPERSCSRSSWRNTGGEAVRMISLFSSFLKH